jgi:hypothetical protein
MTLKSRRLMPGSLAILAALALAPSSVAQVRWVHIVALRCYLSKSASLKGRFSHLPLRGLTRACRGD